MLERCDVDTLQMSTLRRIGVLFIPLTLTFNTVNQMGRVSPREAMRLERDLIWITFRNFAKINQKCFGKSAFIAVFVVKYDGSQRIVGITFQPSRMFPNDHFRLRIIQFSIKNYARGLGCRNCPTFSHFPADRVSRNLRESFEIPVSAISKD